jgi:type VI secretion system secreted protein Hcp
MFLKWGKGPDIKGEATEDTHKGWIAIDSINVSANRAGDVQVGSGQEKRHKNPPNLAPVSITRTYDKASPLLFNASVVGEPTDVYIDCLEPPPGPDKPPNLYLSLALRACIISNYSMAVSAGGPTENLSLSYTAVNIDYTPYDETGKASDKARGFFDLLTGKAVAWK